jgi:hypothetical protein
MGFEQFVGGCDSLQWVGRGGLVGRSSVVIPDFRGSGVITVVLFFRRVVVHFNCYQNRIMRGARSFLNVGNIFLSDADGRTFGYIICLSYKVNICGASVLSTLSLHVESSKATLFELGSANLFA